VFSFKEPGPNKNVCVIGIPEVSTLNMTYVGQKQKYKPIRNYFKFVRDSSQAFLLHLIVQVQFFRLLVYEVATLITLPGLDCAVSRRVLATEPPRATRVATERFSAKLLRVHWIKPLT